jgi:hypothetical protein
MNVASVENVTLEDQSLKQLVRQEIDRQLNMVPDEITQSIDRQQATLEVLKLLSPMKMQGFWKEYHANQYLNQILNAIVADATSLSLIRLVCHTAIAFPILAEKEFNP